jgi:hypothetical protein
MSWEIYEPSKHWQHAHKSRRKFALPPFDIDYLLAIHSSPSTYACKRCKLARKRG